MTLAKRVDLLLNGLRPKIEMEGSPVRWTLAERMAEYRVPGASIAIVEDGRVVWAQGFGVTEVGGDDPVTATTLFQAASCSKPIVASAMLRLVDQGTLALDTNVNDYLHAWKLPDNTLTQQETVTLRRLANHSAGTTVGGFRGYAADAPLPTLLDILDGKAPANSAPVRVDKLPGEGFRYSGGGYEVLQQVLVEASATPFPDLLQGQVLTPLGMRHSSFAQPLPDALAAHAARGHEKDAVVPGRWHVYPELAAAGMWTTPTDMALWAIAVGDAMGGRSAAFLSPDTAAQIINSALPGPKRQERVGLGLFLSGEGEDLGFSHGGQNEGYLCEFRMHAGGRQGVIVMINTGESGYGLIQELQFAANAAFGWPEVGMIKLPAVAVEPTALDTLTGTYAIDIKSGRQLPRIVRDGTHLYMEGWGTARRELYPQSATTFIDSRGTHFAFGQDAEGRATMTMGEGARAMVGLRQAENAP